MRDYNGEYSPAEEEMDAKFQKFTENLNDEFGKLVTDFFKKAKECKHIQELSEEILKRIEEKFYYAIYEETDSTDAYEILKTSEYNRQFNAKNDCEH